MPGGKVIFCNLRIVLKQLFDHLCWMVTIIQNSFLNYKCNHDHKILSNNRILHCMSWQKLYYNMIKCFFISDLELIRSENWDTLQKILFFKIVILHLNGYNTTRILIGIFKRKEIQFTLVGNSSNQSSSSTVLKINHILFSKRFKSLVTRSKGVKPSAFLQFTSNMAGLDFEA